MRNILIIILVFIQLSVTAQPASTKGRITNNYLLSNVLIEGETNLNGFSFAFDNSKININPKTEKFDDKNKHNENVVFYIPVRAFRGSNSLMEGDFQNLLKADEYPMVKVSIKKETLNSVTTDDLNQTISFYLTIAGVTKLINGNYIISNCNKDEITIQGITNVKLTDFSIVPPKKMLGVLYVKDLIFIKFDIIISTLNI